MDEVRMKTSLADFLDEEGVRDGIESLRNVNGDSGGTRIIVGVDARRRLDDYAGFHRIPAFFLF